jgi:hypothetical protein
MNAPMRSDGIMQAASAEAIKVHAAAWDALVQEFAAAGFTVVDTLWDEVIFTSSKPDAEARASMDRILHAHCDKLRALSAGTLASGAFATDGQIGDKWITPQANKGCTDA